MSRDHVWPIVDEGYWADSDDLPGDVRSTYAEIRRDPTDFLFLSVTRSLRDLWRMASFIEAAGLSDFDALAVEIDTDDVLKPCDPVDVTWLGYEPYARGEWGLLSLLDSSDALKHWVKHVNAHGLLSSPESCVDFANDYLRTMGNPGGPEPIAGDSAIEILHVGLVPRLSAETSQRSS